MKKLTTILIIAAVAGGAAWLFGTEKGREFLEGFKDDIGDTANKVKKQINSASDAAASIIKKTKRQLMATNSVH